MQIKPKELAAYFQDLVTGVEKGLAIPPELGSKLKLSMTIAETIEFRNNLKQVIIMLNHIMATKTPAKNFDCDDPEVG